MTREQEFEYDYENSPDHWITKAGVVIAIRDMTDSHLVNTIKFLLRAGEATRQSIIDNPPCLHGEMAQYAADAEWAAAMDGDAYDYAHWKIEPLMEELYRRELDLDGD